MPSIRALGSYALAVLTPFAAAAQPEERPGMPPAPPRPRAVSPAFNSRSPAATIVQVNVDERGMNILGDAANEPSIAIDPMAPNRIVIGWRQFDSIESNFRQAGYAWSNDGGRSWHFPGVLTPGVFRSDPVLESDSSGTFYYYTLPEPVGGWKCELFKSTDGGVTWGPPILANGGDRAWMTIDRSGGVGDGNIYGIWTVIFGCCNGNCGRDTSKGMAPWPPPFKTVTPTQGGTVAVGPDGEVYAYGRNTNLIRSDDAKFARQNVTFALNKSVSLGGGWAGFPGNPGGASGQAWIDVNRSSGPARGTVHIAGLALLGDTLDVATRRSTDQGLTWSAPVRVNDDPPAQANAQWFPSMSLAPSGRMDITYNSTHESGTFEISRTYCTSSTDEGATWSPAVPLTPQWNSTVGWPQQNKIGDYYDQQSDDVGVFLAIAATMNGEQDVYFVRIGDWDCNQNGVGDTQDLAAGVLQDCDENSIPDSCEIAAGAKSDRNSNGIPDICESCYADCDLDRELTIDDFVCFQTYFALGDGAADCDESGILDIDDFICFQTMFAGGC